MFRTTLIYSNFLFIYTRIIKLCIFIFSLKQYELKILTILQNHLHLWALIKFLHLNNFLKVCLCHCEHYCYLMNFAHHDKNSLILISHTQHLFFYNEWCGVSSLLTNLFFAVLWSVKRIMHRNSSSVLIINIAFLYSVVSLIETTPVGIKWKASYY
jgi:hypothetical protein